MDTEGFAIWMKEEWGNEAAEIERKKLQIDRLMMESPFPPMLKQFFDWDSDNILDKKIKILTDLKNGKTIAEIPEFYSILELYPADETHWD